jgi:hypothetical protein
MRGTNHKALSWTFAAIALLSGCELTLRNEKTMTFAQSSTTSGTGGSGGSGGGGPTAPVALSVTSMSPDRASFKSGGLVTITGTGFSARTRILVDGQPCPEPGILSTTQATCFLASHPLGPVRLSVYNYTEPTTVFGRDFMYVTDGFAMVSTAAGLDGDNDYVDGVTGANARFYSLEGLAYAPGVVYAADNYNCAVRKFELATDLVTTVAGDPNDCDYLDGALAAARFYDVTALTVAGTSIFALDGNCVRKIDLAAGQVTTVAGVCNQTGSINAVGTAARFSSPEGITNDGSFLYVADKDNNMIRRVSMADYTVTTLAGQRTAGKADLIGTAAKFYSPNALTTLNGKLYVADYYNSAVRTVDIATGAVTTLTGGVYGDVDGPKGYAKITFMTGITTDGTDLYFTQSNHVVRRVVLATGEIRLLAGTRGSSSGIDGMIDTATLYSPVGIVGSPTEGLFVSNYYTIRRIQ